MKLMRTIAFAGVLLLVLVLSSLSYGGDIYITQNVSGADTGLDRANAHSVSWFNTNATGGNTYHLCGTFTGAAGSTMLTVSSGSAGNLLTILFESDAVLTASYWGGANAGAINISNASYVTIDGGTNGKIENTANGTALANQQYSQGIYINTSNNIEVKNLTIENIYVNGGSDPDATDLGGFFTSGVTISGSCSYILIHDNTLKASRMGVNVSFGGDTIDNIHVYSNYIEDHCWGIAIGAGSGGEQTSNITIHDNEITGWLNWQYPSGNYHTDGIIAFQPRGNTNIFEPQIYNNYIHGDLGGGSATAYIYVTYGGGSGDPAVTATIYNNLLVNDGDHNTWMLSTGTNTTGHLIYNNTLIGRSGSGGTAMMLSGTNTVVQNNMVANARVGIGSYIAIGNVLASSDNNVWYNINNGNEGGMFGANDGRDWYSWTDWQGLGYDSSSTMSDPLLNASYKISSESSSAYSRGANLTSAAMPFLNFDMAGATRPEYGAWDAGVYQYGESSGGDPSAPTGLTIVQQ
jgi:hypothetical protein